MSEKNHLGDISKVSASYILIQCLQDSKKLATTPLVLADLRAGTHTGSTAASLAGKLFSFLLGGGLRHAGERRPLPNWLHRAPPSLSNSLPAGVLTSEMWPRLLQQMGGAYSWAGSLREHVKRGRGLPGARAWPPVISWSALP